MRVLIATCVFPPSPVVSARTSKDVADFFHNRGDEVTVFCPKKLRNTDDESITSLDYKRVLAPTYTSKSSSMLSRFLENITYALCVLFHLLFSKKYDVIYCNVWPIFSQLAVVSIGKLKNSKVILSVQDLYPESLSTQGRISEKSIIYRILFQIDKYVAKKSDLVFVISSWFYEKYKLRGINENKLRLVPNWISSKNVELLSKGDCRKRLRDNGIVDVKEKERLIVYGGNVGIASGLNDILSDLANIGYDFKLLIAGSGSELDLIKEQVKQLNLEDKVYFYSPWPFSSTDYTFGAADFLMLPTLRGQDFASVPSKLISYMLAEKPILGIVSNASETGKCILNAQCGFTSNGHESMRIADTFNKALSSTEVELHQMGRNAREYALREFSFRKVDKELNHFISKLK